MYRFLAVLIFATVLPLQLLAEDAPRAEVFGGFQYYRANTGTDVTDERELRFGDEPVHVAPW